MKKNIFFKFVFLFIFLISLILPILRINQSDISKKENRTLSLYKPLYDSKEKTFNFDYGKDLESWLKDRFFARNLLIRWDKYINYYLSFKYPRLGTVIIDKEKKFLYEHAMAEVYNQKSVQRIIENLNLFDEYCQQRNTKFYTVIIPRKEMIYQPDFVKHDKNDEIKKMVSRISTKSKTKLIFPLDEMIAQKEPTLLYHKTDHHSTMDGTFLGYNAFMEELKKDFPEIKIFSKSDFSITENNRVCTEGKNKYTLGATCNLSGLSDEVCDTFLDEKYRYYKHKDVQNLKIEELRTDKLVKYTYRYPKGGKLKMMIFGDSFVPNLMEILPYSFQETVYIRLNGPKGISKADQLKIYKYYKNEIEKFNPDIIVIYVFYSHLGKFRDLMSSE